MTFGKALDNVTHAAFDFYLCLKEIYVYPTFLETNPRGKLVNITSFIPDCSKWVMLHLNGFNNVSGEKHDNAGETVFPLIDPWILDLSN